jgi:hypothetical protein
VGFLASGAAISAAGLGLKITGTVAEVQTTQQLFHEASTGDACNEACSDGPTFNMAALPTLLTGASFMSAGMYDVGRMHAYEHARAGRRTRRGSVMTGVGFSLLAVGLAGGSVGVAASWISGSLVTRELAWYGGIAMGMSGALMAGYGLGYARGTRRYRTSELTVAPMASPTFAGVGASGRF